LGVGEINRRSLYTDFISIDGSTGRWETLCLRIELHTTEDPKNYFPPRDGCRFFLIDRPALDRKRNMNTQQKLFVAMDLVILTTGIAARADQTKKIK